MVNPNLEGARACCAPSGSATGNGVIFFLSRQNDGLQGRIQDFHLRGAQKIMCPHAHYDYVRGTELTYGRGPGPA